MNDIEAAAKALALQFDLTYLRERNTCASEAEARTAGWLAVARHALAHAARGEGERPKCYDEGEVRVYRCGYVIPEPCPECQGSHTPPPATSPTYADPIDEDQAALAVYLAKHHTSPATGEAGTSEVEKARAAVVDAAKARRAFEDGLYGVAVHPGADRERHRWYVAAENASIDALLAAEARALPEAREGGGK